MLPGIAPTALERVVGGSDGFRGNVIQTADAVEVYATGEGSRAASIKSISNVNQKYSEKTSQLQLGFSI
jgi:hypothetical protein